MVLWKLPISTAYLEQRTENRVQSTQQSIECDEREAERHRDGQGSLLAVVTRWFYLEPEGQKGFLGRVGNIRICILR